MPTIANIAKINGIVISGAPAVPDAHTLIATQTATTSPATATLSFVLGLDSLYDAYEFRFTNMHAATDESAFGFQVNAAGATGFNEYITSTAFKAEHDESDSATGFGYNGGEDQAQGTAYQRLSYVQQIANDEAYSGVLTLYAPSSTTYVKNFVAKGNYVHHSGKYSQNLFIAGYVNTTSALDEISFKFESGNIDAGVIKMYGIAKS